MKRVCNNGANCRAEFFSAINETKNAQCFGAAEVWKNFVHLATNFEVMSPFELSMQTRESSNNRERSSVHNLVRRWMKRKIITKCRRLNEPWGSSHRQGGEKKWGGGGERRLLEEYFTCRDFVNCEKKKCSQDEKQFDAKVGWATQSLHSQSADSTFRACDLSLVDNTTMSNNEYDNTSIPRSRINPWCRRDRFFILAFFALNLFRLLDVSVR